VVPELDGRVIALGAPNILRVPDPGEWRYPRAGGISVSLSDGYLTAPRVVEWQVASATPQTVTLTGRSDPARALKMQIGISGETLRVNLTLTNTADSPARVAMVCRAEFACGSPREAVLRYRDRSGKEQTRKIGPGDGAADGGAVLAEGELPRQQWDLACKNPALRVRNRFRAEEVARCGFNWSFRGAAGLSITMIVGSPEVELAPGRQFALTSEYDLRDHRLLA
jgi:hypothetical protein